MLGLAHIGKAALAQLVEQFIRNEKVASSIPASGTIPRFKETQRRLETPAKAGVLAFFSIAIQPSVLSSSQTWGNNRGHTPNPNKCTSLNSAQSLFNTDFQANA